MNKWGAMAMAVLVAATVSVLAGPAEDLLAGAERSEVGLVAMAESRPLAQPENGKGRPTLDAVALEALLLAFQDVGFNKDLSLDHKAPAAKALAALRKKYNLPELAAMLPRLLANANPAVRAQVVSMIGGGIFGADTASVKAVSGLLANESDPGVLYALIRGFANEGGKRPVVGEFLVKCLDNPEPLVRRWAVLQSCSSWNTRTPNLTEKLAEMMASEPDVEVRKAVLGYAGKLGNDALLVPAYEAALKSITDQKLLAKAVEGLTALWWGYPLYNFASEPAYRLTLKFLSEFRPEKLESSAFTMLSPLGSMVSAPSRGFDAWKEKSAAWYQPSEVRAAVLPFFTNVGYSSPWRNAALKALIAHGATKDELSALVDQLAADGDKEFTLNGFRSTIEKMK